MKKTGGRRYSPGAGFRPLGEEPGTGVEPLLVFHLWWNAVGLHIARNAYPTGIRQESLLVTVPEERWREHLEGMRPVLLERIRRKPGGQRIRDIRFQAGSGNSVPARRPTGPPGHPPGGATPPAGVLPDASGIGDPHLRERFLRVAGKYLTRIPPGAKPDSPGG